MNIGLESNARKSRLEWNLSGWWRFFYLLFFLLGYYLFFPHNPVLYTFYLIVLVMIVSMVYIIYPSPLDLHVEWGVTNLTVGDTNCIRITLKNKTFLPWTRLALAFRLPIGLGTKEYIHHTILGPHGLRIMRVDIECRKRGVYLFPPLDLIRSDLFGLGQVYQIWRSSGELVVYPALINMSFNYYPHNNPIGSVSTKERAGEDFSSLTSLREYSPGDPMRKIDWKATARMEKLMVKEYELTASGSLSLVPDLNAFITSVDSIGEHIPRTDMPVDEVIISATATVASMAIKRNMPVTLISSGSEHRGEGYYSGRSKNMVYILEKLARIDLKREQPTGIVLRKTIPRLPVSSTLVIVSPDPTRELLMEQLFIARQRNIRVFVLWLDISSKVESELSKKDDLREKELGSLLENMGVVVEKFTINQESQGRT